MIQQFVVSVRGVTTEIEIILRFAHALHLQHGGFGWTPKSSPNWNAFSDDLSSLNHIVNTDTKRVIIIVDGLLDVTNATSTDISRQLVYILATATDPKQRCDGLDFYFQVRL